MVRSSSRLANSIASTRIIHPRRPTLFLRKAPGRTFPAQLEPGRAMKRTQAQAAEEASTRDTVAQRRRRISICDTIRSNTFSPLRDERIRTNRAQFEAPPPTESAAAKATRPRLSRERWPGRSHAPHTRAHRESCPKGNYSDLPQRRCPAHTPHKGRPRELSVVRVRKPCDTSRIHSFALSGGAFARAVVRNRNCEGRSVFAPNAGRKRNAPAAFQRPTALLFSYYLRGCSRARSFRAWTVRNLIVPTHLARGRGSTVTTLHWRRQR